MITPKNPSRTFLTTKREPVFKDITDESDNKGNVDPFGEPEVYLSDNEVTPTQRPSRRDRPQSVRRRENSPVQPASIIEEPDAEEISRALVLYDKNRCRDEDQPQTRRQKPLLLQPKHFGFQTWSPDLCDI